MTFHIARAAAVVLATIAVSSCRSTVSLPADLVLHSGKITTVNTRFDVAEALAVRADRIVAVGSSSDILALQGPETRVIDLKGRTVIPGLIDSHSHVTSYGMHVFRPDLSKVKSVADIVALIKAKVNDSRPGEWVTNSRIWNETKLEERRNPTRLDLDPISPVNPVYLSRGHLGVINTAAMKVVGLTDLGDTRLDVPIHYVKAHASLAHLYDTMGHGRKPTRFIARCCRTGARRTCRSRLWRRQRRGSVPTRGVKE